jgi:hypothetical protein
MLDTTDMGDLLTALSDGEDHALIAATGGEPDLEKLERYAQALEVLRRGVADGTLWFGWVRPTEEDVGAASQLVDLARGGAPREALAEPAWKAYRAVADPGSLYSMGTVLPQLAGEPCKHEGSPEKVLYLLDRGIAFFERGGTVAGFTPTPEDLARVRRLREIATTEGAEALEERKRLVAELWARYPKDAVSEGIWRCAVRDEKP